MWCIHAVEYYTAVKINGTHLYKATHKDVKNAILHEMDTSEKNVRVPFT